MWSPAVPRRAAVFAGSAAALAAVLYLLLSAERLALLGLLAASLGLAELAARLLTPLLPCRLLPGLRRRAVLVTGCDSGFGHAAALRLDALGAPVFAGCLLPEGPGAAALRRQASAHLTVLPLDVTSEASVRAALAAVRTALQPDCAQLWAVVNNAGILKMSEFDWTDVEDVKQVIDVNCVGQIRVTKAFLPLLKKSNGRVVNVNSLASRSVCPALGPYCVSKHASLAFTNTLRTEMAKFSVSVHSIEPFIHATPMMERSAKLLEEAWYKSSDEIKISYGVKYIQKFKKSMKKLLTLSYGPSKTDMIVDAILDACYSKDPQIRYVRGALANFLDITCQNEWLVYLLHYYYPSITC